MGQMWHNDHEAFVGKLEDMLGITIQCYTYICRLIQFKKKTALKTIRSVHKAVTEKHKKTTHSPRTSGNYGYAFGGSF